MFGSLAIFNNQYVRQYNSYINVTNSQNAGCSFISDNNKDNATREISTKTSNKAV